MEPIIKLIKENPAIVSQLVSGLVSLLVAYGVLQFGPEQAAEFSAQVTAVIFGIGQIVGGVVSQNFTSPAYRVMPRPEGE